MLNELLAEGGPPDLIDTIDMEEILDTVDRESFDPRTNLKRRSKTFPLYTKLFQFDHLSETSHLGN